MNINGRLSAVLALTSTGCTTSIRANWRLDSELDNSPLGAYCHILRTGYAAYCSQGRVEERDAGDNLVRNSQVSCSPHMLPVGSRGTAVYSDARILPKETSASLCEAHSLEMCPLNHAPPAASTPLLATSFCMEAGARRRKRQRPPRIPRPRGQPPPRRDPAPSDLCPSPLHAARRGGLAYTLDQCF